MPLFVFCPSDSYEQKRINVNRLHRLTREEEKKKKKNISKYKINCAFDKQRYDHVRR